MLSLFGDEWHGLQESYGETPSYPEVLAYVKAQGAESEFLANPDAVVDLSSLVILSNRSFAGGLAEGLLQIQAPDARTCNQLASSLYIV